MLATIWVVMGGAIIFLLVAAIKSKSSHPCKGIEINIHGVSNNFFVDKKDMLNAITAIEKRNPVGKAIGSFNLKEMEVQLEKDVWIRSAELFFDNNEMLQVVVYEREPVARVFTMAGTTFYIDHELTMLPLSEKFSARLPVFTNFPSDKKVLSKADSSLLADVKTLSLAIQKDSFSMAMVEQIDITAERSFEMIPKIGNQLIVFGDATGAEAKLSKLKLFYKEIMLKAGWDNYRVINVQFKNQVVAKRKEAADYSADSLRALQIMQMIAARSQKEAADPLPTIQPDNESNTVDGSMIRQSIQRDDTDEPSQTGELPENTRVQGNQPVIVNDKPAAVKQEPKPVQKTVRVQKDTQQPKAVMQKKNDYMPYP